MFFLYVVALSLALLFTTADSFSFLLNTLQPAADYNQRTNHLLNLTKAKRCRINLFKRHRFAIANSKFRLLVNSSFLLTPSSLIQLLRFSTHLLIVMMSFLLLNAFSRICADVITADTSSC
ncbi:Bipolar kinesin KRP-130 [Dorcoceras hygrometricum]|uniref:Bipolar kinesin KRP-130 n=1 Tax=Dorcoceras hygrometricum TaxID=472368 RepID=A0A2Z6ZW69_9LAMI|nr:Bipolar kinesin KRP-130 [Dorcoceras hygrometricum]